MRYIEIMKSIEKPVERPNGLKYYKGIKMRYYLPPIMMAIITMIVIVSNIPFFGYGIFGVVMTIFVSVYASLLCGQFIIAIRDNTSRFLIK
jgi:hypothetical protein